MDIQRNGNTKHFWTIYFVTFSSYWNKALRILNKSVQRLNFKWQTNFIKSIKSELEFTLTMEKRFILKAYWNLLSYMTNWWNLIEFAGANDLNENRFVSMEFNGLPILLTDLDCKADVIDSVNSWIWVSC